MDGYTCFTIRRTLVLNTPEIGMSQLVCTVRRHPYNEDLQTSLQKVYCDVFMDHRVD